jgi:hypothetical protein
MIEMIKNWIKKIIGPAPKNPAIADWPFPAAERIKKHTFPKKLEKLNSKTVRTIIKEKQMPLKKSVTPKAFKENIKTEMAAGKPIKQAVAIAYAEKNAAKSKKAKK